MVTLGRSSRRLLLLAEHLLVRGIDTETTRTLGVAILDTLLSWARGTYSDGFEGLEMHVCMYGIVSHAGCMRRESILVEEWRCGGGGIRDECGGGERD